MLAFIFDRINDADEAGAIDRVDALREAHPTWSMDQLVEHLIAQKCRQAAAVGAASSGSGLIPGLGTLVSMTIGMAADLGATLRMQTELVIEIAAVHRRRLSPDEKRRVVLLVGGLGTGTGRAVAQGGARLSLQLTQRYAQRWLARALPVVGVAGAAGINALTTYLIGRRAHAYFGRGPEAMGSWAESVRTLTGVDERRLGAWLSDLRDKTGSAMPGSGRLSRLPSLPRPPWRRRSRPSETADADDSKESVDPKDSSTPTRSENSDNPRKTEDIT